MDALLPWQILISDSASSATSGNKIASPGGFAEYAILESDLAFRIPENVTFDEAATFPLCSLTAAQVSLILGFDVEIVYLGEICFSRHYLFAFAFLLHSRTHTNTPALRRISGRPLSWSTPHQPPSVYSRFN